MIKYLNTASPHLVVTGSTGPYVPHSTDVGQLRYSPSSQSIEVYNGMSWVAVSTTATVDLTPDAQNALTWASQKMQEEIELKRLMQEHPGLEEAYERFQIMKALVQQEKKSES